MANNVFNNNVFNNVFKNTLEQLVTATQSDRIKSEHSDLPLGNG